jgi:hypothetical protein
MKFLKVICLFFAASVFISSCDVINPKETIPTYVHIDSFKFVPNPNDGTSSHKITSVWAYYNYILVGVFDIPCTFPIIADKPGKLLLIPGIAYSGLTDIQTQYPFYTGDTSTINPAPTKTINYTPTTQYIDKSLLHFVNEDFELGNSFKQVDGDTSLIRVSDPNLVFEGKYAGCIYFNNMTLSENILTTSFAAPTQCFLELNYKGTLNFEIGLQTTNSSGQLFAQYFYGFHARADWTKVYVGLQDFIQEYPNQTYRVMVRVIADNPTQGYVSFDNFKVIY